MNRNTLKIIACISMLIDHIGLILLGNNLICRIIGRLAFVIFAYLIADGFYYTKNKTKYMLHLLVFAIISQPIYSVFSALGFGVVYRLNILFEFFISVAVLIILNFAQKEMRLPYKTLLYIVSGLIVVISLFIGYFGFLDYFGFGVIFVLICSLFRQNKPIKFLCMFDALILYSFSSIIFNSDISFASFCQLFSLLALVVLWFYNNKKGKYNLKYLFYCFYPLHLLVVVILSYLIL